jgi:kynureninase
MPPTFAPIRGAQGFQQSNPSILCVASLLGSLQIFKEAGMMPVLRARSLKLTAYLEARLRRSPFFVPVEEVSERYAEGTADGNVQPGFTIITPSDPQARGTQLSLAFLPLGSGAMQRYCDELKTYGVIGDERKPDVIRLAPTALYNTCEDCDKAAMYLEKAMETVY